MAPAHTNLADALETLAGRQPDAPLLHVPGEATLTYAELGTQIAHVRAQFGRWGIGCGDIVAGCVLSRPQMALACAALPVASTFAPLSTALPAAAYAPLLARLAPKAVLVPAAPGHPLRAAAARLCLPLLEAHANPGGGPGRFRLAQAGTAGPTGIGTRRPPDHAYVLVTSGTTGGAKLVPVGHRQMLRYAATLIPWLRLSAADVGCTVSPFHFAGGLRATLLIPWLAGGSVVCLAEGDDAGIFAAIDAFRPTYLAAGFTVHRALLRRAREFPAIAARNAFRFVRPTAGRLEPEEIDRLEAAFGAPVVVGYGSTEVCGIAHDPLPPGPRKPGAVGIATAGEVAIVDAAGLPCPPGARGEIVVRGPLVFDGYLDDPALTAASFRGDWFRTGDLGHIDADGYVFVHGRLQEMINRGGEKIAPAEVDAALLSCAGVDDAAAFGIPHRTLGEELVAAVVLRAGVVPDARAIVDHVRQRLGARRVPRRIHFVDRLPRTDSGKVRRADLPLFVGAGAARAPSDAAVAARGLSSALELAVTALWTEVLGERPVGRDDDFFLLGGDSLRGAQLLARVRVAFGVELALAALFGDAATIGGMARAIERAGAAGDGDIGTAAPPVRTRRRG